MTMRRALRTFTLNSRLSRRAWITILAICLYRIGILWGVAWWFMHSANRGNHAIRRTVYRVYNSFYPEDKHLFHYYFRQFGHPFNLDNYMIALAVTVALVTFLASTSAALLLNWLQALLPAKTRPTELLLTAEEPSENVWPPAPTTTYL